jgi:hypothetical protein
MGVVPRTRRFTALCRRLRDVRMTGVVRAAAAISGAVLLGLASVYYFTYEPAPEIRIRWRSDLQAERRAELERQFGLVNRKPFEDRFSYDLLDARPGNVRALVDERNIEDTDRVDREGATIPLRTREKPCFAMISGVADPARCRAATRYRPLSRSVRADHSFVAGRARRD